MVSHLGCENDTCIKSVLLLSSSEIADANASLVALSSVDVHGPSSKPRRCQTLPGLLHGLGVPRDAQRQLLSHSTERSLSQTGLLFTIIKGQLLPMGLKLCMCVLLTCCVCRSMRRNRRFLGNEDHNTCVVHSDQSVMILSTSFAPI